MSYNKECCNLYAIGKVDYDCEIIECEYECVGINAEVCFLCMCSSCSNVTDGLKMYNRAYNVTFNVSIKSYSLSLMP